MKSHYLRDAWLVLVIALAVGASLAGVHAVLNDRIQANAEAEALSRVPQLIREADRARTGQARPEEIPVVRSDGTKVSYKVYRALDKVGRLIGWVVKTSGQGFGGTM